MYNYLIVVNQLDWHSFSPCFISPLDIEKVLVCVQKAEDYMKKTSNFSGKVAAAYKYLLCVVYNVSVYWGRYHSIQKVRQPAGVGISLCFYCVSPRSNSGLSGVVTDIFTH